MVRSHLLLTIALILGCKPPNLIVDKTMAVYYDGQPQLDDQLVTALPIIQAAGLLVAQYEGREAEFRSHWGLEIHFRPAPFNCGDLVVDGCQLDADNEGREILVVWKSNVADTALANEAGHLVWEIAFGRTGETWHNDGGAISVTFDPDYALWVKTVDDQIRAAL